MRRRRTPFPPDPDAKHKILRDGHVLTFATFDTSALDLLGTEVTPQLTAAAAIAKFVSQAIPQGAGAQLRRSGGPVLRVAQPHEALPHRRAFSALVGYGRRATEGSNRNLIDLNTQIN
jgi:hypothetical protein